MPRNPNVDANKNLGSTSKVRLNVERKVGYPPVYVFPLKGIARSVAMIEAGVIKMGIEEISSGWPKGSEKDQVVGMIGELAFQGLLYYYRIPNVRNISYHQEETDMPGYDFETPIGTIEVKTSSEAQFKKQLQVNKMRWSKNRSEIVAAMKLLDDSGDRVALMGWMLSSDMEKLQLRFEGEKEAYTVDYDKLPNDGESLLKALENNTNVSYEKWGLSNTSGDHVSS